jgi:hypothetical protein
MFTKNKSKQSSILKNNINTKLMKSKKGYSPGFTWVFGLVTLFGLGVLYIVFTQVFDAHLVPVIKEMTNSSSYLGQNIDPVTSAEIAANIDKYMAFFHTLPYILFFVVVIYMLIAALKKEGGSDFG